MLQNLKVGLKYKPGKKTTIISAIKSMVNLIIILIALEIKFGRLKRNQWAKKHKISKKPFYLMPRSNQAGITTFRFARYWIFSFDIWKLLELSDKRNHIFMETSSNSRNNNLKTRWATSKVELFKSKRDVWRKYRLFLDDVELGEVHMIHFPRGIFYTAIFPIF